MCSGFSERVPGIRGANNLKFFEYKKYLCIIQRADIPGTTEKQMH